MRKSTILASMVLASAAAMPAHAVQVIQNGNFNAGLTGWTSFLTANGTISPSSPNQGGVTPTNSPAEIASFNVNGSGASNALWLNAGQYLPPYGTANPAGGGVFQTFGSAAGNVAFSVDIAAASNFAGDTGGLFSVLLDGVVLGTHDFGAITGTTRSTINFNSSVTAGTHTLALQVVRPFGPGRNLRSQYFDNVSLDVSAVPEPATWAMMIAGFGMIGFAARRRTNVRAAFAR